jgi:hypothetical protein
MELSDVEKAEGVSLVAACLHRRIFRNKRDRGNRLLRTVNVEREKQIVWDESSTPTLR